MFDPEADGLSLRRQYGLENRFVVLYAGAHGMSNDLEVVLDAADKLADLSDVALVLLGDGKEKAALVEKAEEMGLENLHFLPPLPKGEMRAALAAADVCLAILKPVEMYKTVYPNKVFDYMAAGRATLLAIDGVIRAVVEDAGAGVFIPPGDPQALADAILQLAADRDRVRQMGRDARRYLEVHFDRPKVAADLDALLSEMIS
jgi:glycosyltransferase involved in cell wall biosynthesis